MGRSPLGNGALIQALGMRFPCGRLTVFCGDCPDQPAKLFSAAAAARRGRGPAVPLAGLSAAMGSGRRRHTASWKAKDSIGWALPLRKRPGIAKSNAKGSGPCFRARISRDFHPFSPKNGPDPGLCRATIGTVPGGDPADEFPGDRRFPHKAAIAARVRCRLLAPLSAMAVRRPPSAPAGWRNPTGPGGISPCKRTFACRVTVRTT